MAGRLSPGGAAAGSSGGSSIPSSAARHRVAGGCFSLSSSSWQPYSPSLRGPLVGVGPGLSLEVSPEALAIGALAIGALTGRRVAGQRLPKR
jgi:hypothetical protein